MALSAKQKLFCEQYLIDLNATQAAIRAGYSESTARQIGSENLSKPDIQSYISELQLQLAKNANVTPEMVISELKKVGFSNIQDFIDEGNTIKDLSSIPRDVAASVKTIKKVVTEWGSGDDAGTKTSVSFEVYDKLAALEKIGRHLGIFEADNKQKSATITVNIDE